MKDQNTPEQTEFDFNESGETEQQRLEREVLAAGGRVGRKEGGFNFGLDEAEGYKRGDEHSDVAGLYFWSVEKAAGNSRWLAQGAFAELSESNSEGGKMWRKDNRQRKAESDKRYYEENKYDRLDYQRAYYEENKGRRAEYLENNKEKIAERGKKYREENKEKIANKNKMYWEENKEIEAERRREWYELNKERVAEYNKGWAKNNPEKVRARNARRRARKLEAFDPSANQAVIDSRYAAQLYLKEVTGYAWHVDHTQPLSRGGKEHENNMQVVPANWNLEKGSHHCDRWIEDSDIYRYATAVEARFEKEAKRNEKK